MVPSRLTPALLLSALVTGGCVTFVNQLPAPPALAPTAPIEVGGAPASPPPPAAGVASIKGRVVAPPGLVAAGGGNVIVNNTGNLVAAGGGNVIVNNGGNLRLLAQAEVPVGGAWVQLADAAGRPDPAVPAVQADSEGRFEILGASPGRSYVVQSALRTPDARDAQLRSLVRADAQGASADLSTATTCVTTWVLAKQAGELGAFEAARFSEAVSRTREAIADRDQPDLADAPRMVTWMEGLARELPALRETLGALRAAIAGEASAAERPLVLKPAP